MIIIMQLIFEVKHMIGLLGVKRNTPLEVREKLIVTCKNHDLYIDKLLKSFKEVVILATCNRAEIYFNVFDMDNEEILKKIFEVFNWNTNYKEYIFISENKRAYTHLFEVCSGFHSKIVGEDQILGQVKSAYEEALKRLPKEYLEAYEMNRNQHLTHKEIAEKLNVSPQTINYRIGQALKLLRVALKDYLPLFILIFGPNFFEQS